MTNKVPNIRFKGFTDDWEQRKLLDVTESIKNGYTYKADGNRDHKYKVTRIESISSGVINVEKLGSSDEINKDYKLIDGDILFSHINSLSHIGNTAMYTTDLGNIYHGMNLLNIRAKQDIVNSHFLLRLLKKDSSRNWFRIIAKPAVNQASISVADVGSFEFLMPNIAEQQKIGEYFSNLDHLITLHQRKCEQTKELKKFMLQKMFPKKGEKNPEIRFPGFTDDWEQRKLGEVAKFINGRAYSQDELLNNGKYKVLRVGNFYTNDSWYYSDMELDDKYYAENGDLLYTWSATFGPHIWHGDKVIYHYHIWKINLSKSLEKTFALQLLERDKEEILADKNGSTMVHITKSGMENEKVLLPENIEEQQKIGEYFSNLDRLITLHQRKYEQLKELKKFMLQNMFPKKG